METAAATETTRPVVIERDIPEPAVVGLVEFIDRYYIRSKTRFIEAFSYRKTISGTGFELFWILKPVGPEQPTPIAVSLKISQAAIELDFPGLDPRGKSLQSAVERTVDEIEAAVLSYFQNIKTTSLYFVIGASEEHSEAPDQRGIMRNVAKRIFTGNTTSLFLSFILLSFILFFIIGVYTVFVLISVQLVALIFWDKIVYRIGSVRPDAERPLVTIVSVRSNAETLKSISQHGKKILLQIREEITRSATATYSNAANEELKSTVIGSLLKHGIIASGKEITVETRADTESAVVVGTPEALGSALTKIGFRQLYREKYNPGTKLFDWFQFDPHPPIYFRIDRLSRYSGKPGRVRHTLLVSIRDIIVGFFSALFQV